MSWLGKAAGVEDKKQTHKETPASSVGQASKPVPTPPPQVEKKEEAPVEKESLFTSIRKQKKKRGMKLGVFGFPGAGKTSIGMSFPEPVFIIDTEMGSAPLEKNYPDKDIRVVEIYETNNDTLEKDDVACFDKIVEAVNELYENPIEGGTIVIDSATDIWKFCQSHAKVKHFKIKAMDRLKQQWDWGFITNQHNQLVTKLLTMPMNVVFCIRGQEEQDGPGSKTGRVLPKCQKDLPFYVDMLIEAKCNKKKSGPVYYGTIEKSRQNGSIVGQDMVDITYDKLIELTEGKKDE